MSGLDNLNLTIVLHDLDHRAKESINAKHTLMNSKDGDNVDATMMLTATLTTEARHQRSTMPIDDDDDDDR